MRVFRYSCALTLAVVVACGDDQPQMPGDAGTDQMPPSGVAMELVAEGFVHPLALAEIPDGTGRLLVADQIGLLRVIDGNGLVEEPVLDVRPLMVELMPGFDERGLLGIAMHPRFADNGRMFVYYTAPPRVTGYNNTSVIAEYFLEPGVPGAQATPVGVLLEIDQPQFNHEGGTLAFGPDGYLYISIGDGGNRDDEGMGHVDDWYEANAGGNGQDIEQNLLGNVLRIDVATPGAYTIPADNPFVGTTGLDEIYAYGLRNPYRFSFDAGGDRALILGDAGQNMWEEIDVIVAGGNYGWNVKEGAHCFDAEQPMEIPASCPDMDPTTGERLRDPVLEVFNLSNPMRGDDELGIQVIIGGYVYRGTAVPALDGRYIFGAFATQPTDAGPSGAVFAANPTTVPWPYERLELDQLQHFVLGFGEDLSRELYVLTTDEAGPTGSTGRVYRLVAR